MLVYRLESELTGQGIYSHGIGWTTSAQGLDYTATGDPQLDDRCPGPDEDEGISKWWKHTLHHNYMLAKQHVCGFVSEEQMLDWFPPEGFALMVEKLAHRDFKNRNDIVVAVYEVDGRKLKRGQRQCMFLKTSPRVQTIPLQHYASEPLRLAA